MPRKCTDFGKSFREKFSYYGKLTKECMGPELWNEYCKVLSKNRTSSLEHKRAIAERKVERKDKAKEIAKEREKLRMLNGYQYKKYCKTPELVENFYEAQKDCFKGWVCHHKLEQMFTAAELISMGIYYDCKQGELMFIRKSEHNGSIKLHYGCRICDKSPKKRENN